MKDDRAKLLRLFIVLLIFGFGWISYPFVKAFGPAKDSIHKWQTHINLKEISPGEIKEYLVIGETIWIYRRTKDEIDWLNKRKPYDPSEYRFSDTESVEYHESYRSIDPEHFVFSGWKHDDKVYLKNELHWWLCGSISYHPDKRKLRNDVIFNGVISCTIDTEDVRLENESFVYDVSGLPTSKWMSPLKVPYYEITNAGNYLVHGPRP